MPGHAARSKPGVPLRACEFEAPADPNWERRSNEEWVRPFVPHGSADFNYSLATGEQGQWVAQYFPKDPSKYPLSTYMTQKTTLLGAKDPKDPVQRHCRSNTMTTSLLVFPTDHSAFLAVLDFIWERHKLFHPECTVPKIVQEAMAANNCCTCAAGAFAACQVSMDALRATGLANSIERPFKTVASQYVRC